MKKKIMIIIIALITFVLLVVFFAPGEIKRRDRAFVVSTGTLDKK
jgi:hypothetical protein